MSGRKGGGGGGAENGTNANNDGQQQQRRARERRRTESGNSWWTALWPFGDKWKKNNLKILFLLNFLYPADQDPFRVPGEGRNLSFRFFSFFGVLSISKKKFWASTFDFEKIFLSTQPCRVPGASEKNYFEFSEQKKH